MNLAGRTALVTGAGVRIGRAIARALAARGAGVAIHYHRSRAQAQALARELQEEHGARTWLLQADLGDAGQTQRLAREALKALKRVDVLVNNASIWERTPLKRATVRDFDRNIAINLRAPFLLSRTLGLAMKRSGGGKIVHIADWAGLRPYGDYIPYCVSKAGLLALNAGLAKALAPQVQVNAVMPGPVLPAEGTSAEGRRAMAEATVLKRLGSPEDVASAVLFFLEGSDFVTGAALPVEGGRLLR